MPDHPAHANMPPSLRAGLEARREAILNPPVYDGPPWWELWAADDTLRPRGMTKPDLMEPHSAALCEHAAIVWLRSKFMVMGFWSISPTGEGDACVMGRREPLQTDRESFYGPTLGHALFAACKALLDAREGK